MFPKTSLFQPMEFGNRVVEFLQKRNVPEIDSGMGDKCIISIDGLSWMDRPVNGVGTAVSRLRKPLTAHEFAQTDLLKIKNRKGDVRLEVPKMYAAWQRKLLLSEVTTSCAGFETEFAGMFGLYQIAMDYSDNGVQNLPLNFRHTNLSSYLDPFWVGADCQIKKEDLLKLLADLGITRQRCKRGVGFKLALGCERNQVTAVVFQSGNAIISGVTFENYLFYGKLMARLFYYVYRETGQLDTVRSLASSQANYLEDEEDDEVLEEEEDAASSSLSGVDG